MRRRESCAVRAVGCLVLLTVLGGCPPVPSGPDDGSGGAGACGDGRGCDLGVAGDLRATPNPDQGAQSPDLGGTPEDLGSPPDLASPPVLCSPVSWSWRNPLPQGNALYGAWGTDANNVWAVGSSGTIPRAN